MFLEKINREDKRQVVHLLLGAFITASVWFLEEWFVLPLSLGVFGLLILSQFPNFIISRLLVEKFEKHRQAWIRFWGAISYGLGILPAIVLIPYISKEIACAIVIILSVGDSFSTLIGRRWGTHKIKDKSLEGFLGFLIFSFLSSAIFIPQLLHLAFLMSFLGGMVEIFTLHPSLEDNILVPWILLLFYVVLDYAGLIEIVGRSAGLF